jgi:exopolysaccharide biosynthesis polyprenyl glycosylphosphotransferase
MTFNKQAQQAQRGKLKPTERSFLILIGDLFASGLALLIALYFWASSANEYFDLSLSFLRERPKLWFYLLPVLWLILLVELYDPKRAGSVQKTISGVLASFGIGVVFYAVFYFAASPGSLPRLGVAVFLIASAVLTLVWRLIFIRISNEPAFLRRVLVVGGGRAGSTLLRVLREVTPTPFLVLGVVDDDSAKHNTTIEGVKVLGSSEHLAKWVEKMGITDILVAISGEVQESLFQSLLRIQETGVDVTGMQTIYEELLGRIPIFHFEADWLLRTFIEQSRVNSFYLLSKRLIDMLGGLFGSLIVVILYPFVALAILLESGRPIFYSQSRSGLAGQPYNVLKFRTMFQNAEKDGVPQWATKNDDRVTRVGRILRKTHIDELPQFFNVLRGDMSLVGPRPERPKLVQFFEDNVPFYRARLLVKPGITGWAQVNYGYTATVEETSIKLEYDLYYIKNRSVFLDILVLLRTPATMLGLRGR